MDRQRNGIVARPRINPADRNGALGWWYETGGHAVEGDMGGYAVEGAGTVDAHS
jgi:hypothetical protein